MNRPLTKQEEARRCLAAGSFLIDPRYQYPREKYEEMLKQNCRKCWALREWWPNWVRVYADRWAKEKSDANATQPD